MKENKKEKPLISKKLDKQIDEILKESTPTPPESWEEEIYAVVVSAEYGADLVRMVKSLLLSERKKILGEYNKPILLNKSELNKLEETKKGESWRKGYQYGVYETIAKTKDLITKEMLICRKENTKTSRLTSLFNKILSLSQEEIK